MSSAHGIGRTRAQVLQILQGSTRPLTVTEIAQTMHLHANSVRFHLDSLIESGFATSSKHHDGQQGRPRLLYSVTDASPLMLDQSLLDFCRVLLRDFVMSLPNPFRKAEESGFKWGVSRAEEHDEKVPPETDDIDVLTEMMATSGFVSTREGDQIAFTRCPYKVAAVEGDDLAVICSVHHGMIQGFLNQRSGGEIAPDDVTMGPGCTFSVNRSASSDQGQRRQAQQSAAV